MAKKAKRRGKRYTAAETKKILATAVRERLTGAQVRKRFGVSMLTFYRWRGPVGRGRRAMGATPGTVSRKVDTGSLRGEVRAGIDEVLPGIIREEVRAAIKRLLG